MGGLKKLLGKIAPVAAPFASLIPGVGPVLGGALTAGLNAVGSIAGAEEKNLASARAAADANAFSAEQAELQRNWSSAEALTARNFNAEQARQQMAFQERLSSSAHQREVADLRAAGLNPILSGSGGMGSATPVGASAHASAPSGSSASGQKAEVVDVVGPAVSAAVSSALAASQIGKQEAETADVRSQTRFRDVSEVALTEERIKNLVIDTGLKGEQAALVTAQLEKVKPEIDELRARAKAHLASSAERYAAQRNLDQSTRERKVAADADEWAARFGIPETKRALEAAGMAGEFAKDIAQAIWGNVRIFKRK